MIYWLIDKIEAFNEWRSSDLHREIGYREIAQPHIDAKGFQAYIPFESIDIHGNSVIRKTNTLHPIYEFSGRTYIKTRDEKPDVLYREICTTYKCITSSLVRKSTKHEWKKEDDVKYVTKDYKWVSEYDIIKILE